MRTFVVTNLYAYGTVKIKSEFTGKSFKANGHRLKSFLSNPSLLDIIVEEISLLDPTSFPSSAVTKRVFFSFSFLAFIACV